MYPKPSEFLERHRITRGSLGTTAAWGNNGAFLVPGPSIHKLQLIASDQEFWEHVSVSVPRQSRTPTRKRPGGRTDAADMVRTNAHNGAVES